MIVHLASFPVRFDNQLRQRCAWCGAVLVDVDLSLVMVPVDQAGDPYPTWRDSAMVAVDGNASWEFPDEDPGQVPAASCMRIDPTVTR